MSNPAGWDTELPDPADDEHGYVVDVLAVFEHAGLFDTLRWRVVGRRIRFAIPCDGFNPAGANTETIEPGDVSMLLDAYGDLASHDRTGLVGLLFVARKRRQPPRPAWLVGEPADVVRLFTDAATATEPVWGPRRP